MLDADDVSILDATDDDISSSLVGKVILLTSMMESRCKKHLFEVSKTIKPNDRDFLRNIIKLKSREILSNYIDMVSKIVAKDDFRLINLLSRLKNAMHDCLLCRNILAHSELFDVRSDSIYRKVVLKKCAYKNGDILEEAIEFNEDCILEVYTILRSINLILLGLQSDCYEVVGKEKERAGILCEGSGVLANAVQEWIIDTVENEIPDTSPRMLNFVRTNIDKYFEEKLLHGGFEDESPF